MCLSQCKDMLVKLHFYSCYGCISPHSISLPCLIIWLFNRVLKKKLLDKNVPELLVVIAIYVTLTNGTTGLL